MILALCLPPQELLTNRYDVKKLWHFSPIAYANKVKTPTLIMQGEWDTRTPIGQGEEFFSALAENGVETEMSRYPQSWHGVSRDGLPNLRIERIKETRRWWDKH
ncbi:alpha/beta hydrolase family protein [Lentilactobacillus raoultii]|uniref:Alpha/beta hydrolase family protein n=1 Tax=Lentilactobacillus raoultii TaxID=1987503 RepID=A0ABW3PJU4_9LACO|nr:prolyl oligopeptidase family serine peptidase [Lentilactobacillus raoultii]